MMRSQKRFWLPLLYLAISILLLSCQSISTGQPDPNPGMAAETNSTVEKTFWIGPEKVACEGAGPMECYQVKEDPNGEWELFYDEIEGLSWEPDHTYEIRVTIRQVENPPADGSSLRYELIEVVNETEASTESEKSVPYIQIQQPVAGAEIDPGQPILINGMGGGLFEGNVVVQMLDSTGAELALQATIIQSPEAGMGGEGPWQIELNITADAYTEGKIVAYSPSPEDGSWMASDEIAVTFASGGASTAKLENTNWQLTNIADEKIEALLTDHLTTANFNPEEGRVSGVAGCNQFYGEYQLDGGQLRILSPILSTKMACTDPQLQLETAYLDRLAQVTRYELIPGKLTMFDAEGAAILIFQVIP